MWNFFYVNFLKRKIGIDQNNGFKFDSEITWRHPLHHLSRDFPSIPCFDRFYIIQADNLDYSGKGESFQLKTFELIQLPELVVYICSRFSRLVKCKHLTNCQKCDSKDSQAV